jgi:FixJ family two-component response regulator
LSGCSNRRAFERRPFLSAEDYLQSGNHGETACLILDVRLPGMSGLELQHNLAAKQNEVPIIMMSALDRAEIQVHALASAAVTLLGKPFDDNSLNRCKGSITFSPGSLVCEYFEL